MGKESKARESKYFATCKKIENPCASSYPQTQATFEGLDTLKARKILKYETRADMLIILNEQPHDHVPVNSVFTSCRRTTRSKRRTVAVEAKPEVSVSEV